MKLSVNLRRHVTQLREIRQSTFAEKIALQLSVQGLVQEVR